jgi:DNA-binding LacI/PurR family transcriptional regulator
MITGPQVVSTSAERVNGYCEALAEAGIQPCSDLIIYGYFTEENGYTLTRQLLESKPRPTALFAANNRIAMGAFRALEDVGLRVPEDISLVAFDGLPPQFVLGSYLTVAEQPAYEMGQRATELLLERLCGQAPAEYQHIVLPAEIIVRKSSGPPPETAVKLQGGGGDGNAS